MLSYMQCKKMHLYMLNDCLFSVLYHLYAICIQLFELHSIFFSDTSVKLIFVRV